MMNMLLVTNYQNDFLTGSRANPLAKLIENNIITKVDDYLKNGDWVVFTYDDIKCEKGTPAYNYPDIFNKFFVEYPDDILQVKTASIDLINIINAFAPWDKIEICGIFADSDIIRNCSAVQTAIGDGTRICVDINAIAGTTNENKQKSYCVLQSMGVDICMETKNSLAQNFNE